MRVGRWADLKKKSKLSPARRAEVEREARAEMKEELIEGDLRAVREIAGKTQTEAAKLLETTQSELSRLERRDDYKLSTLRRFVEAMGGELEIVARIGKRTVRLRSV
jgi:predicted transcriptional regulator